MAKRVTHTLTDDLDGTESRDVETVKFGYQGAEYEIDLKREHREDFALAIGRYLHVARHPRAKNSRSRTEAQRAQTRAIRAWALEQGTELFPKGRIPGDVIDAYWAAHETETGTEK